MTIRARLLLAQLPVVLALVLAGGVALHTLDASGRNSERLYNDNYRSAQAVQAMRAALAVNARASFDERLVFQEHNVTEPGEEDATRALRREWEAFTAGTGSSREVLMALARIEAINETAMARKIALARAEAQRNRWLLIGASLAALMAAAAASAALSRRAVYDIVAAQETLQAAIDGLPDPVVVLDAEGAVVNANDAARATLAAVTGVHGLRETPPEARDAIERLHQQIVRGQGAPPPRGFEDAIRVGNRALLPRATPLRAGGAAVVLQDVTRPLRFDELKSDLVATVAHELRTPLTSLRMTIELLLDGKLGPIGSRQWQMLKASRDDCARLSGIAEDLLDLSRIEAGKIQISPQPCPSRDLVAAAVVARSGGARDAEVRLESAADETRALADRDRIALVLDNLIVNAIRHSPAGARVQVSARADGPRVRFEVADEGPGIAPEHREHVFEKFFRVPGASGGGVGLGLYIAREIVSAHGGQAGFDGDHGSRFWFTLPRAL
jgi:NtrC-family two-component system sensor histidine kinase KinB